MKRSRQFVALTVVALATLFLISGCDMLSGLFGNGPGTDPVTIPDSVAADSNFATLENDFFTAINKDRTDHAVAVLTRETSLDALARRYSSVCKVDVGTNLVNRVKTARGACTDAAYFLQSGASAPIVATTMGNWLGNSAGTTAMRNAGFTKIGIGIVVGVGANGVPGPWDNVVVLLAKP